MRVQVASIRQSRSTNGSDHKAQADTQRSQLRDWARVPQAPTVTGDGGACQTSTVMRIAIDRVLGDTTTGLRAEGMRGGEMIAIAQGIGMVTMGGSAGLMGDLKGQATTTRMTRLSSIRAEGR